MITKDELRKRFSADWEKHYKIKALVDRGYKRGKCKLCGKHFWSMQERDVCGDSTCIGYGFIGNPPTKAPLGYVESWKKIENYFVKQGLTSIPSYPTVARWRDDLYFTVASINDFQPYVVNGEMDPPANPLIVPQACIRFSDITNVGISGRHYTNFVMIGQHAFNTKKTGLFYWKDEAISHDIGCLLDFGIKEEEIIFSEDVWLGGGNFGPCLEYFVRGLELGNCVFVQYGLSDGKEKELETKVIDMGAGLSRFAWISTGDPTSYEVVFGPVIKKMKEDAGVSIDKRLFTEYAKLSGRLNVDEVADLDEEKKSIAAKLGVPADELFGSLEPLHALYAVADHLETVLLTVTDGMLPSNAGGGYNLRLILRRAFGFDHEFGFNLDYGKIVEGHAECLKDLYPRMREGVQTVTEVIEEEKRKYGETQEKAKGKVTSLIQKAKKGGKGVDAKELSTLYQSDGVPLELVEEIARKEGFPISFPPDFYGSIRGQDGAEAKEERTVNLEGIPKTTALYYDDIFEFDANVVDIRGKYLILDKTAFYPESGGQMNDTGTIDGERIRYVKKEAGVILHEVKDAGKFSKGKMVHGKVDKERRLRIAKHHAGAHLLNAACREVLGPHIWQTGSYKDEEKAHLDVTHFKRISQEQLNLIEQKVNGYISSNLPIKTEVLPRGEAERSYGFRLYQGGAVPGKELRVVSMDGIDHQACGGTHNNLCFTGEIGAFKIVRREGIQDGVERIVFKCGAPAIAYIQERESTLNEAASSLKVPPSQLTKTIERFFNEWKERGKELDKFNEMIAGTIAERKVAEAKGEKKDRAEVTIEFGKELAEKIALKIAEGGIIAVVSNNEGLVTVVCPAGSAQSAIDILHSIGAKGGGDRHFARGKLEV